jgi:hypothetical protein
MTNTKKYQLALMDFRGVYDVMPLGFDSIDSVWDYESKIADSDGSIYNVNRMIPFVIQDKIIVDHVFDGGMDYEFLSQFVKLFPCFNIDALSDIPEIEELAGCFIDFVSEIFLLASERMDKNEELSVGVFVKYVAQEWERLCLVHMLDRRFRK